MKITVIVLSSFRNVVPTIGFRKELKFDKDFLLLLTQIYTSHEDMPYFGRGRV